MVPMKLAELDCQSDWERKFPLIFFLCFNSSENPLIKTSNSTHVTIYTRYLSSWDAVSCVCIVHSVLEKVLDRLISLVILWCYPETSRTAISRVLELIYMLYCMIPASLYCMCVNADVTVAPTSVNFSNKFDTKTLEGSIFSPKPQRTPRRHVRKSSTGARFRHRRASSVGSSIASFGVIVPGGVGIGAPGASGRFPNSVIADRRSTTAPAPRSRRPTSVATA